MLCLRPWTVPSPYESTCSRRSHGENSSHILLHRTPQRRISAARYPEIRCYSRHSDILRLEFIGDPRQEYIQKLTTFKPTRLGTIITAVTATATERIIPEPSVPTTTPTKGESVVSGTYILTPVRLGLFTFTADFIDIGEEFYDFFCAIPH